MWERIISAIDGSDSQLVNYYLTQDPNLVFEQNYQKETLLHYAAKSMHLPTVIELLARGARADVADGFGWTPLHEACNSGNEDTVALFIKTGISLNLSSSKLETPLHVATRKNHSGIVARLLAAGAHKNPANKSGNTPLHLAAQKGFPRALEVLIAGGADVRARNKEESTPLHLTAIRGNIECAEILLRNEACPEQLDGYNRTFMEIAEIFKKRLYIAYIEGTLEEIKAQKTTKIEELDEGIPAKPEALKHYFCKEEEQQQRSASNKEKKIMHKMLHDFIFGTKSARHNSIYKALEAMLWFLVFPLLMFVLWQGFASYALSPIITLNLGAGNEVYTSYLQPAINLLIVLFLSYLFVTTDQQTTSQLHFFKDLRESIHFRILHLALIETYFVKGIQFSFAMAGQFLIFWAWFMGLYAFSYLIWWADTHCAETSESKEALEYQTS